MSHALLGLNQHLPAGKKRKVLFATDSETADRHAQFALPAVVQQKYSHSVCCIISCARTHGMAAFITWLSAVSGQIGNFCTRHTTASV